MNGKCLCIALLSFLFLERAVYSAVIVNPWQPVFKGIEFATGEADTNEVRLQKVQVLRIDLHDPEIEFFSTPSNGEEPLETTSQTTSQFLTNYNLQVAINANFFSPCCSLTPEPKNLMGLAVSRGEIVSPHAASGTGSRVLLITRSNQASIAVTSSPVVTNNLWTAVAGSDWVVIDGVKPVFPGSNFYITGHPRTAVGISQDGRYLLMMTIDGRRPGYSDGAPMDSLADWLIRFGAYNALNLDGGGSTTMVKAGQNGPVLLNQPSGSTQRMNGNNLGVYARSFAPPLIVSSGILPDQRFHLFLNGEAGLTYAVEASTNLSDWIVLTNILAQSGAFDFTDIGGVSYPLRYYRLRWP